MIKLFRNIRKNLLAEGKTTRYFKYAIGEIVLVVIGILIALQINNWNENQLERNEETKLLYNIKLDLQNAVKELQTHNHYRKEIIIAIQNLYEAIDNPTKFNAQELDSIITPTWVVPTYNGQTGTINQVFTTGKISIIRNENLKAAIISWPQLVEDFVEDELYAKYVWQEIKSLAENNISIYNIETRFNVIENPEGGYTIFNRKNTERPSAFKSDYSKLLSNIKFEGLLSSRENSSKAAILQANGLIKEAQRIIALIDQEIKP